MICDKCGSERVHWRCDNHEKGLTKYKCLDCGEILVKKTEKPSPLFNKSEMDKLKLQTKEDKKRLQDERLRKLRSKGGRKRWLKVSGKNYSKNSCGHYMVQKMINGETYYCGTYKTEEIAKKMVGKMTQCGWDISKLEEIKKEVHKEVNL